jgi:hypothetical protein
MQVRQPPLPTRPTQGAPLAKPNYSFEKRQRELAKKKKKEEKEREKAARKAAGLPPAPDDDAGDDAPAAGAPEGNPAA